MERTGYVVGLTGQTGAGKSVVSKLLANEGYKVIDADQVSRQVVGKGSRCLMDLALEFGIGILKSDGALNRKKLGSAVFGDNQKREKLNEIIFPYITEEILLQIEEYRRAGEPVIFLDAPTLFESGADSHCDRVAAVIAPLDERKRRIMSRDHLTWDEADNRIASQFEDDYYTSRADYVIENSGDFSALRFRLNEMLKAMKADMETE